ncbi:hypothetical protein [Tissierella praeacuta]|uniref:hypothetical protein n=1 Tax=Tissierella praeacuta TaxID=43131 RepID=UPI003341564A
MKRYNIPFAIFIVIILMMSFSNRYKTNKNYKETKYYIIEDGKKNYYPNAEFIEDISSFDLTLENTIKSLNEIKDGKRDLTFITEITSEELKDNKEHKIFSNIIPGEIESQTTSAYIQSYSITGLQYDKDKSLIKVLIAIETKEKYKGGSINVFNNQTYIYKIDNKGLSLTKYDLSQYLE